MRPLVIRLAAASEVDEVVRVRRDAILALAPEHATPEEAAAWADRPDRPERCRASIEAGQLWVAVEDGEVVAWLEVVDDLVHGLYVVPGRWRGGLGSRLMDLAESRIRANGHHAARLNSARPAMEFYRKRGYEVSGEPPLPWRGTPMIKRLG